MNRNINLLKMKIKYFLSNIFLRFWRIFHPIEKKVLFSSFAGKQYSEDPRAISEKLHELYPDYKIVWSFADKNRNDNIIPDYVHKTGVGIDFLKEFSTSAAFVTTNAIETNIYKRKGQFIVQTWHGDRGFKKTLYEAWENGKRPVAILDDKLTDICVAASDYGEDVYRKAFRYTKPVLKIGMPRNDKLINNNNADEVGLIKKRLNIDSGKKILLYAPTFRDKSSKPQDSFVDIDSVLYELNKKGGDWICLIRAHASSKGINIHGQNNNYSDVSNYPDMADLLLISDMLITDYSSCAGDFLLRKKPIILAVFDKDEYEKNCRSLRISLEDTGYFIAYNQNELNSIIRNNNDKTFKENCEKVLSYYNTIETGKSSEEICNRINNAYQDFINKK